MPTLTIRFQTNELVPPPHAFAIEANINLEEDEITGTYELSYLDREDFTEEELWEEGYTPHDDAKWEIDLPTPWLREIKSLIKSEKLNQKTELEESQDFWEIISDKKTGYPENPERWFETLNQLQQAILEYNEIEAPLNIQIMRIDGTEKMHYRFEASFVSLQFLKNTNGTDEILEWSNLNTFLKDIYSGELLPENATKKEPSKTGIYLNPGDEHWYELGKSYLIRPGVIKQYLDEK